ncbi:hypothetical protein H4R20_005859 [Coemansia guatemalensis]|uniref:Copper acquisition factor BIM1-like domain-containing protein n=1 Tax=Coemansia guatemalensis TaxID=2761395 RepID=A0A9W8LQD7_9FUNG|nr:hypothetical protein H4R20_005859 [Coemansia guatemalensis]
MVKLLASGIATIALLQSAWAHMQVISPSPRSGITADQLIGPCGGANSLTKNVTTFAVDGDSEFVLRAGHGTGNIIFSYFTVETVDNNTKAHSLKDVPVPKPDTYNTTINFSESGLKSGDQIVVQAIYNGTDEGETEEYYVCFDVKLADEASGSDDGSDTESEEDSSTDDNTSSSSSLFATSTITTKAVFGTAFSLLVAAAAF